MAMNQYREAILDAGNMWHVIIIFMKLYKTDKSRTENVLLAFDFQEDHVRQTATQVIEHQLWPKFTKLGYT